jgi:hypothetical protein
LEATLVLLDAITSGSKPPDAAHLNFMQRAFILNFEEGYQILSAAFASA